MLVEDGTTALLTDGFFSRPGKLQVLAGRIGAMLLGSQSTANVGRGHGLPEERIRVVVPGEPMSFGTFTVTLIESEHSPHALLEGTIDRPFSAPARAGSWAMGECYSILIEHRLGTILVHASANFRADPLHGRQALRSHAIGRPNAPCRLALAGVSWIS